jgi:hypothetical protein
MKRWYLIPLMVLAAVSLHAVDFDAEIQPIFTASCVGCHGNSGGLSLASGSAEANLVDVVSTNYAPALRVASGDPAASVLYNKVAGTGVHGQIMPVGGTLTTEQIALISDWITELGAVTPLTIAEARLLPDGTPTIIQGIVTATTWGTSGSSTQAAIQDDTGGMVIYAGGFDAGLAVGDEVIVSGAIDIYGGLIEIAPSAPTDIELLSSGNDLPEIQVLTLDEIATNGVTYESEYVRIDSVTIVSGTWPTGTSSVNLTISDPSGTTLTMRIDGDTDLHNYEAMLGYFNLTAIVGRYYENFQVFPRYYSDLEQIGDPTPLITDVSQDPASPTPLDEVTVSAMIIDNSDVVSASLEYVVNGGVEMVVVMTEGDDDVWSAVIPAQAPDAVVSYAISATDDLGGLSTTDAFVYVVYGGDVTAISQIQDGTIPTGASVTIEGIVTAEPYAFYPEDDLRYYFIQDDEAALSGIKVYDPGRAMKEGDEVRLTGTVAEYNDLTEILDVTEFEILSSGHTMNPMVVTLDMDMELYESCLITVENVTVTNADLGYGEWLVSDGTNDLVVDDAADYFYTPELDEEFSSITGVLEYSFGAFKLEPRIASDLEFANGLTRIQAIQQVRYSDLLPKYTALDSSVWFADTSYYYAGWTDTMIVTIQGIVTMPTGLSYAGNGIKFIIQDVDGGPWSSILSYHPDSSAYPVLYEGDLIQMEGYIAEYVTPEGNSTSNMTEFFITSEIDLLDFGLEVPEEPVVSTGDLRWPTTAEQWGNVVVKVEDATILENDPTPFDILLIDDGSGAVRVDDDSDSLAFGAYIQPPAGSVFESVRGWVYHHFGTYLDSSAYKLVPLYQEDLVLSTVSIDNAVMPDGFALGNYPNPFNPSTTIAFQIPRADDVHLIIYNQLGQHVATLVDQPLSAGNHDVVWNGLDGKGKPVSSGLYFYRLVSGQQQMVGKMTFLK